jgi:hypothetical protein
MRCGRGNTTDVIGRQGELSGYFFIVGVTFGMLEALHA